MKLSLVISGLFLGFGLMFSGCGSDSSDPADTDGIEQEVVEDVENTFSAAMLAGKTLSVYGYESGGVAGENRMSLIISDDASTCDVVSLEDANDIYASDAVLSISEDSIGFMAEGALVSWSVISFNENAIYAYQKTDRADVPIDAYPLVMTFEEQADNGVALLNSFASETVVTNAKLSAIGGYVVEIQSQSDSVDCIMSEFTEDGAVNGKALGGETWSGTYTTANNTITYTFDGSDDIDTVLALTDDILITQWNNDNDGKSVSLFFNDKQDAIDFALSYGTDCSGDFAQLEQD